jgi:hypothetical protein
MVAPAGAADTVFLDHQTPVPRMGFGTMQLPGPGVWGPPRDRNAALTILSCPSAGGTRSSFPRAFRRADAGA